MTVALFFVARTGARHDGQVTGLLLLGGDEGGRRRQAAGEHADDDEEGVVDPVEVRGRPGVEAGFP